jgi:predicted outer membrane repeat protein
MDSDHLSAIVAVNHANIILVNTTVRNCSSTVGGAIFASKSNLSISVSNFIENNALERGGAIFANDSAVITESKNTFSDNKARLAGGALHLQDSTLSSANSKYEHNKQSSGHEQTSFYGGGMFLAATSELTALFSGTVIENNEAVSAGGGIFMEGPVTLKGEGTKISKNKATGTCGGGVLLQSTEFGYPYLEGFRAGIMIEENHADANGGGVCSLGHGDTGGKIGGVIKVVGNAAVNGGGFYCNGTFVLWGNQAIIQGNKAIANGGGLFSISKSKGMIVKIHDVSNFQENEAAKGGGMFASGIAQIDLMNSTFLGNVATDGGNLFIDATALVVTKHSKFIGGQAEKWGGGILVDGGKLTAEAITISQSNAISQGGGLHVSNDGNVTFFSCKFAGNEAFTGGGMYSTKSIVAFKSSSLEGNKASEGGGLFLQDGTKGSFHNTTVSLNSAEKVGGGFVLKASTSLNIFGSKFRLNTVREAGGAGWLRESVLNVEGSTFTNNSAMGSNAKGGDLHSEKSEMNMTAVHISSSSSSKFGGSLSLVEGSKTLIRHSRVDSTYAYSGGFAYLFGSETQLEMVASLIRNTSAVGENGGALYVQLATLKLNEVNIWRSSAVLDGGAIFANTGANLVLGYSNITQSAAKHGNGGGLALTTGTNLESNSVHFSENFANRTGGSLYSLGSTVDVNGCFFKGATSGLNGGAVASVDGKVNILKSLVTENICAGRGGGIFVKGDLGSHLSDLILTANKAGMGGGLYAESASLTCRFNEFQSNEASKGGAVYTKGCALSVNSNDFVNNTALKGGGMYLEEGIVNIVSSNFSFNLASGRAQEGGGGGGMFVNPENGNTTITGVVFTHNVATNGDGGGILCLSESSSLTTHSSSAFKIYTCTFFENEASKRGGAAAVGEKGFFSAEGSNFYNNTAQEKGGGVAIFDGGTSYLSNTVVQHNRAVLKGGGGISISDDSSSLVCHQCLIVRNVVDSGKGGGGIFASEDTSLTIKQSEISQNKVLSGDGGGIASVTAKKLSIENSTFQKNSVDSAKEEGSSLFVEATKDVTISLCNFSGNGGMINQPSDAKIGGLMYVRDKSKVDIHQSSFTMAKATIKGGAIAIEDSMLSIADSEFFSLRAELGGGIFMDENAEVNVSRVVFKDISAARDGGGVYAKFGFLSVSASTFLNITVSNAGGGIYVDDQKFSDIVNTVFEHLNAKEGAGVYVGRGSRVKLSHSLLRNCHNDAMGTFYVENNRITQEIESTTFLSNFGAKGGGAIYSDNTKILSTNSTFISNKAGKNSDSQSESGSSVCAYSNTPGTGGAVMGVGGAELEFFGATFSDNSCHLGGAISVSEKSRILLSGGTASNNKAFVSGGVLSLDKTSSAHLNSFICTSNQAHEFGGCVAAEVGSFLNVVKSKFRNNSCFKMGGSVFAPGLVNNNGVRLISINESEVIDNKATAGRSVYWNVNPFSRDHVFACAQCLFDDHMFDSSRNAFNGNIATGAISVKSVFLPNQEIESGMPILENSTDRSNSENYFKDSDVRISSLDYYGNIALFDNRSTCNINRTCPGNQPYDESTGVCGERSVVSRAMKIIAGSATSAAGSIRFSNFRIQGKHTLKKVNLESRGEQSSIESHNPYSISINCNIGDDNMFKQTLSKKIMVGLCAPGRQPDGKDVCEACSAGTYSLTGLACLPCPDGANCTKSIVLKDVKVQVGVPVLRIKPGYWHDTKPDSLDKECVPHVIESWTNSSCRPGQFYTTHNNRKDCKELIPGVWGEERLYRCRTNNHVYKCPQGSEACNWQQVGNSTEVTPCNLGYTAKLCGSCARHYYRASNESCIPCGTEVVQTKFFYILILAGIIQFLMILSWLHFRERGLGLVPMFRNCQRQCSRPKGEHKQADTRQSRHRHAPVLGLHRNRSKIIQQGSAVSSVEKARQEARARNQRHEDAKTKYFRPEKWKIMLSFFQIFSQYSSTYQIPWPHTVVQYMRMFNVFNLDVLKLVALDCVIEGDLYQSFLITACVPIIACIWIGVCLLIGHFQYTKELKKYPRTQGGGDSVPFTSSRKAYQLRQKAMKGKEHAEHGKIFGVQKIEVHRLPLWLQLDVPSQPTDSTSSALVKKVNVSAWTKRLKTRIRYEVFVDKIQHLFFSILLLAYVPVSGKVMRLFRCVQVGEDYFIMSDLKLQCYTFEYKAYLSIATACVFLYVTGIPLLFLWFLWSARNAGVSKIWRSIENNENRKQFWLAHAKAQKEAQNELWQEPKSISEVKSIILSYIRKRNLRSHKAQARFGFICEAYKEKAWWYECFELTRKLALTGGIALIRPGSTTQILAGLSFTAFFSYFAMYFKPYRNIGDDVLYNVCMFQLFTALFIGLLTKLDVSPLTTQFTDIRVKPDDHVDVRAAAGNPSPDDFLPWVVIISHLTCIGFAAFAVLNEMRTAKSYQRALKRHENEQRNRVRQTLRKWAKARRMALLEQARKQQQGENTEESLEDATRKAMEKMEREKEQNELEKEMQQLQELKRSNQHLTEADDSSLTAEQRELKEFLLGSVNEVSRRKQALAKQVERIEQETQESADIFNNNVEKQKDQQHQRLLERLAKRQSQKQKGAQAIVKMAVNAKKARANVRPGSKTKVMPTQKSPKRPAPPRMPKKNIKKK